MSNEAFNAHQRAGCPMGDDEGLEIVADWAGHRIAELEAKVAELNSYLNWMGKTGAKLVEWEDGTWSAIHIHTGKHTESQPTLGGAIRYAIQQGGEQCQHEWGTRQGGFLIHCKHCGEIQPYEQGGEQNGSK